MSDGQGIFGVFFCAIIYIEEGFIMPTITLFAIFAHNGLSNWFCTGSATGYSWLFFVFLLHYVFSFSLLDRWYD